MIARRRLRRTAPVLLALCAFVLSAAIASAYPPPATSASETSGCASVSPGQSCSFTFRFLNGSGQPASSAQVNFSLSGNVGGATVSPQTAVTDSNGDVSASFVAGAGSTCGTDTLTATAAGGANGTASTSVAITVPCTGGAALPATSTNPPGPSPLVYILIALGVVVVAGGALTLRKTRPVA